MGKKNGLSAGNPPLKNIFLSALVVWALISNVSATSDKDIMKAIDQGFDSILEDLKSLSNAVDSSNNNLTPSTPIGSTPTGSTPTGTTPNGTTPTGTTPTGTTPTDTTPTGTTPTGTTPTGTTPTGTTPTDTTPTGTTPTDTIPTGTTPTDTIPTGITPTDTVPTGTTPTDTIPNGRTPTSSTPTGSPPSPLVAFLKYSARNSAVLQQNVYYPLLPKTQRADPVTTSGIVVCTGSPNTNYYESCEELNTALTNSDVVAQEVAAGTIEDRQVNTINDAKNTVNTICTDSEFQDSFDPADVSALNAAIEKLTSDSLIVKQTYDEVTSEQTWTIVVSVVGSLLLLAVVGLAIGLCVVINKYNGTKKPKNDNLAEGHEMEKDKNEPEDNTVLGVTATAVVVDEAISSGRKTPAPTAEEQAKAQQISFNEQAERGTGGPAPIAEPQDPRPYGYNDSKIDNTQMRSLGGSYPPNDRGSQPPSRNDHRRPYSEPRPRDPYAPRRDENRSRPSSYYPPPSNYMERSRPGSSRPHSRPSNYSTDRRPGPPPKRSSSYRATPKPSRPPRSRSDIRGPYGPEDLY